MSITIVIPVYNEEKRILPTLKSILSWFSRKKIDHEVAIVDDGSTDNTLKVIEDIKNSHPEISIFKLPHNSGKGAAVRKGMLKGKGDYILFMDADSSTPIEEFEKFLPAIKNHKDIIIGTRKMQGADIIEYQPFFREFLGKGFTWLSKITTRANISDFTCGFKCFSRKATKDIFSKAIIDNWSFDAEIVFLAGKFGYKITEVPVRWKNNTATKVRMLRDVISSLKGLWCIQIYNIKGLYEK
jgi:dolichyl-phosphate beta-glucosyltransferase